MSRLKVCYGYYVVVLFRVQCIVFHKARGLRVVFQLGGHTGMHRVGREGERACPLGRLRTNSKYHSQRNSYNFSLTDCVHDIYIYVRREKDGSATIV